jgi:serine/threonine protein kinase/cytochrome c-type biogenesis protein CcmH/NrfG
VLLPLPEIPARRQREKETVFSGSMNLAPGTRLGPYEIVGLIGSGGMGFVYKARDQRLQRDVAIKLLRHENPAHWDFHTRLEREARAAAAVTHPHICTLYDIHQEKDASFLVMEYLAGETLATKLSRGALELSESVVLGAQIAEALAAAHARKLIHCDLKPGNVMLTETGAKLLDFGLAKVRASTLLREVPGALTATDIVATDMLMGTLQYMAPEQIEGRGVDHRADIFSLGAVLYEMITGRQAFTGQSRADIIATILKGDPPSLRKARAHVPSMLSSLVKTCLAKEPGNRWQSAADVATSLRTIATGLTRRRSDSPSTERSSRAMRSLVVLPLHNHSGDPNQQYLADGMTECLISSMSVIGQLKIISRSSAMKYRDTAKPLQQIAKELGVDGIVRGSVRRSERGVGVSVALLEPVGSEPLWSEDYDRPLTDVFRVQGEIAETIAAEIYLKLTATERRRFRSHRATSPEISEAYLRGRYYWNRETPEALARSFEYLSVAVQRDPEYGAAHAALADWYLSAGNNGLLPIPESLAKAKTSALRALELDPGLAEAYASLGRIAMHECDIQRARAEFETSLRLNPNLVEPVIWSARALSYLGVFDDATARVERAKQLDPVSPRPYLSASAVCYVSRNYQRAMEEGQRALEFEPRLPVAFYFIGMAQLHARSFDAAIQSLNTAVQVGHRHAPAVAGLAVAFARAGRIADTLKLIEEMKDRATRAEISPYFFAEVYLALGDVERALTYLKRSYELRIPDMIGIAVDPLFDGCRDRPEFKRIVHDLAIAPRHL